MAERTAAVTLKGKAMTLVGEELKVGAKAPDFTLTANDLSPRSLADYAGKVKILSVVPSLDTPVCDTQTRKFNERAAELGPDGVVLTISMDLPMAQNRWCGATGAENVQCLSDYKDHTFGSAYGVRIKEVGLLARTVIVLDRDDTVKHLQLVPEVAEEPNYDAALDAAKALV